MAEVVSLTVEAIVTRAAIVAVASGGVGADKLRRAFADTSFQPHSSTMLSKSSQLDAHRVATPKKVQRSG